MNFPDACKILGLAAEEDPRPHLAEFRNARDRIAAMVAAAPNEILAGRYRKGLDEFDEALAAVESHLEKPLVVVDLPPIPEPQAPIEPATTALLILEEPATDPPPLPLPESPTVETPPTDVVPSPPKTIVLGTAPTAPKTPTSGFALEVEEEKPRRRGRGALVVSLLVMMALAAGAWIYLDSQRTAQNRQSLHLAELERQGALMVENRRWQEAEASFAEIETLSPGSEVAARGRRSIESGMNDEQRQFVGYWTGQAIAGLEAGRLDEAEAAAHEVLAKYPNEAEAAALLEKIATARAGAAHAAAIGEVRTALDDRNFPLAIAKSEKILAATPADADAAALLAEARAGLAKAAADVARAGELFAQAKTQDTGKFDQQALDWIREAKSLDPDNEEIAALFEKLSSYTRTINVPGDFATPAEALAEARDRDRVVIAAGNWEGPLIVNSAIELQGAGAAETKIECTPDAGSVITIGPEAKGALISGISFRHKTFAVGTERYSVALVRGGTVAFSDCQFTEASGHGLAVIENGHAAATRCRFDGNGWNGAAVIGNGSTLEMRECESLQNFEHGIESWDGAAVILVNNRCEANSRNGIHADNGLSSATIEGNQLIANREFGLVVDSAGAGKISTNTARGNMLGGMVIRAAAASLPCTSNTITANQGPGLTLESGLSAAAYTANTVTGNAGQQIHPSADLADAPTPPLDIPAAPAPAPAPPATAIDDFPTEDIPRATIVIEPAPDDGR